MPTSSGAVRSSTSTASMGGERQLVGIPVGEQVRDGGDAEGDQHAALPAEKIADDAEQGRQRRKQHGGLHDVHRFISNGKLGYALKRLGRDRRFARERP